MPRPPPLRASLLLGLRLLLCLPSSRGQTAGPSITPSVTLPLSCTEGSCTGLALDAGVVLSGTTGPNFASLTATILPSGSVSGSLFDTGRDRLLLGGSSSGLLNSGALQYAWSDNGAAGGGTLTLNGSTTFGNYQASRPAGWGRAGGRAGG